VFADRVFRPRRLLAGLTLIVGAAVVVAMGASRLAELNVLAAALLAALLAPSRDAPSRRALLTVAQALVVLALWRMLVASVPILWIAADRLGGLLGQAGSAATDRPLWTGATFGGVDFLVTMLALLAGYLPAMRRRRVFRGLLILLAIAAGHLLYLVVLAFCPRIVSALPDTARWGWDWASAARTLLPWNVPALAAAIHLAIAAAMIRWSTWPAEVDGEAFSTPARATVDEITPHGVTTNERTPYGATTNGITPHGATTNGITPHGATTNERTPHGATTNERTPYGVTTNERTPHGVATNGTGESEARSPQPTPPAARRRLPRRAGLAAAIVVAAALPFAIELPAWPILAERWAWADAPDAGGAGAPANGKYDAGEKLGDLVLSGEQKLGKGTIVALADGAALGNLATAESHAFVGRLLDYPASRPAGPAAIWRQAVSLLAGALLVMLLLGRAGAFRPAAVAIILAGCLWAATQATSSRCQVQPAGKPSGPQTTPASVDAAPGWMGAVVCTGPPQWGRRGRSNHVFRPDISVTGEPLGPLTETAVPRADAKEPQEFRP
jgi:hypothetical protein